MPLLVDTGILYALADRRDAWHRRVVSYLENASEPLLAPVTVVPEVAYLLRERIGPVAEQAFIRAIERGEVAVEPLVRGDWPRIATLTSTYEFLGLVDASVLAVAERLKAQKLATTDRRHFGAVLLKHGVHLTLVP